MTVPSPPRGSRSATGSASTEPGTRRFATRSRTRRVARSGSSTSITALEEIWALKDVSFEVAEGEVVGFIGRNGAGKSTLLKVLTRITPPTEGTATIRGRVGSMLEVGTGLPSRADRAREHLPERRDPRHEAPRDRREVRRDRRVRGVAKFIDTPVKRYSSGMYVRLAFAVAAHLEPEVLLVDEVLAVGDAEFQQRCLGRMEEICELGPHRALRLPRHAGGLAALRSGLLARGWPGRRSRGRARTSSPTTSRAAPARAQRCENPDGGRARRRDDVGPDRGAPRRRQTTARRQRRSTSASRSGSRSTGVGDPRPRAPLFPKIKVRISAATSSSTPWTPTPAGSEPVAAGARTSPPRGSRRTSSTRASSRSTSRSSSLDAPKLRNHVNLPSALTFHVHDPGEGDSSRGLFTGQLQGAVRPLLEWTVERVDAPTYDRA